MGIEIEKKYTVKKLPEDLASYDCHIIEQAYLNTDPVIRIRREDDTYYLTYKGKGLMTREEYNLPLNQQSYCHLLKKADGHVISKQRYLIPLDSYGQSDPLLPKATIELDIFDAPFAPLVIAEVEFPDLAAAEAFQPPDWFAEEVTMDKRYHNSALSQSLPGQIP